MGVVRIVEVMGKFARATSSIYSRHELQARACGGKTMEVVYQGLFLIVGVT